jgi:hypothetical protein
MFASFFIAAILIYLVLVIVRGLKDILLIALILWALCKAGLFQ